MQDKKKKNKKQSKVRDLKPKKDAKGGMRKAGIIAVAPKGTQGPKPDVLISGYWSNQKSRTEVRFRVCVFHLPTGIKLIGSNDITGTYFLSATRASVFTRADGQIEEIDALRERRRRPESGDTIAVLNARPGG